MATAPFAIAIVGLLGIADGDERVQARVVRAAIDHRLRVQDFSDAPFATAFEKSIADLEKGFKEFAVQVARGVGPNLDWEKPPEPKPGTDLEKALADWGKAHPTNYYSLRQSAQRAIATLIPDEWMEPSATGSVAQCVERIRKEFDYGADALIMHGATPDELEPIVEAYRAVCP